MWFKEYRDYKIDQPLIKDTVESGHGIVGCEMHELNGWGTNHPIKRPRKEGLLKKMMAFFSKKNH